MTLLKASLFPALPAVPSSPLAPLSRRHLLHLGTGMVAAAVATGRGGSIALAREPEPEHWLRLRHNVTGEEFEGVFWRDGRPVAEAMARLDWLLRDPRNDKVHRIDNQLLLRLSRIQEQHSNSEPLQVLSAFRTPESNRRLVRTGASRQSLHMKGAAMDIRLAGVRTAALYRSVLNTGEGGSGCYPRSGFVHVDSGPTRRWLSR